MASLRASRHDPFFEEGDLLDEEQTNLLTSADEDMILGRYGSVSNTMRRSCSVETIPAVINLEDEEIISSLEGNSLGSGAYNVRTGGPKNFLITARTYVSAKTIKMAVILFILAFGLGCLTSKEELEEGNKHLIGVSSAEPIISFSSPLN